MSKITQIWIMQNLIRFPLHNLGNPPPRIHRSTASRCTKPFGCLFSILYLHSRPETGLLSLNNLFNYGFSANTWTENHFAWLTRDTSTKGIGDNWSNCSRVVDLLTMIIQVFFMMLIMLPCMWRRYWHWSPTSFCRQVGMNYSRQGSDKNGII